MSTSGIFHRRQLPSTCIDLASAEGQKRFISAISPSLSTNTTHPGYVLNLLSQFRTQDEPSFCGISTLVMCLNALMIDPSQTWKGVWRWWSEELLDCCVSLDDAKKHGITLDEFVCLAVCQGVDVQSCRPPPVEIDGDDLVSQSSYQAFRTAIFAATSSPPATTSVFVVSYDRKVVGQTGSGHFSPVGAYDEETDSVLVLDVARFKYPPHWMPMRTLWEATRTNDKSTGKPRGWVTLTRAPDLPTLVHAPGLRSCGCLNQFVTSCRSTLMDMVEGGEGEGKGKGEESGGGGGSNSFDDDVVLARSVPLLLENTCCSLEKILRLVQAKEDMHKVCYSSSSGSKVDGEELAATTSARNLRGRILSLLVKTEVYKAVTTYLLAAVAPAAPAASAAAAPAAATASACSSETTTNEKKEELSVNEAERMTLLLLAVAPDIKSMRGTGLAREVSLLRTQLEAVHDVVACCSKEQ